jgi:hypothetical protein
MRLLEAPEEAQEVSALWAFRERPAVDLLGDENHILLVAATGEPVDQTDADVRDLLMPVLQECGMVAYPWRVRLLDDKTRALTDWPYFYLYAGAPVQALIYRMRVSKFRTIKGQDGMPCPWPDYSTRDYRGWTAKGHEYTGMFRTWFLIDQIDRLDPNIPLHDLLDARGSAALPWSLVPSYGLWRLRIPASARQEAPRAESDLEDVTQVIRGTGVGQGFISRARVRRAIELRAMEVATRYFQNQNWAVTDVAAQESYDLLCTKNGTTRRVEVKGTAGTAHVVLVTANEVQIAQQSPSESMLAVVYSIVLDTNANGEYSASGGHLRLVSPWDPDPSNLEAVAFRYTLPWIAHTTFWHSTRVPERGIMGSASDVYTVIARQDWRA